MNTMHLEIDEECINLIALRGPVARDLRLMIAAIKINSELERIGDQAVNISENTEILLRHPQLKPYIDIPRMEELVSKDASR
jgi:phosphate transport system protein